VHARLARSVAAAEQRPLDVLGIGVFQGHFLLFLSQFRLTPACDMIFTRNKYLARLPLHKKVIDGS
jgi:hypothetical protein